MSHTTTKCRCGVVLSTCRCPSPNKSIIISPKPCTHQTGLGGPVEPVQAPNTPQTVQPARGDEIALMVPCSKGCGVPLGVTNDMLELAKRANMPLDVKHEVCPGEEGAPLNKYRMAIEIYLIKPGEEAETLLTKMGDTLEGRSFAEVFDGFSNLIQSSWQQVEKVRHIVDQ